MPIDGVHISWTKLANRVEIPDIVRKRHTAAYVFEDIGHSCASVAGNLGYSEATIAALIGHKGHSVTGRYMHAADAVLLAAADAPAHADDRGEDPRTARWSKPTSRRPRQHASALALLVEMLRLDVWDADAHWRELEDQLQLATARVVIGDLFAKVRDELERQPANLLMGKDYRMVALEHASAGIRAVQDAGCFRPEAPKHTIPRNRKRNPWHMPATMLAKGFIVALKETNLGVEIGVGKDGPVTRFIAKIMPFITGEQPKVGAIEKHLRDHLDLGDI